MKTAPLLGEYLSFSVYFYPVVTILGAFMEGGGTSILHRPFLLNLELILQQRHLSVLRQYYQSQHYDLNVFKFEIHMCVYVCFTAVCVAIWIRVSNYYLLTSYKGFPFYHSGTLNKKIVNFNWSQINRQRSNMHLSDWTYFFHTIYSINYKFSRVFQT